MDAAFLKSRGWHQWYNDNYWVNPKCIQDPQAQDYTNYGMSLEQAIKYENDGAKPFAPIGQMFNNLVGTKYPTSYKPLAKPISDDNLGKLIEEIKEYERLVGCPHNKSSLVARILQDTNE